MSRSHRIGIPDWREYGAAIDILRKPQNERSSYRRKTMTTPQTNVSPNGCNDEGSKDAQPFTFEIPEPDVWFSSPLVQISPGPTVGQLGQVPYPIRLRTVEVHLVEGKGFLRNDTQLRHLNDHGNLIDVLQDNPAFSIPPEWKYVRYTVRRPEQPGKD